MTLKKILSALSLVVILVACGGGGSESDPSGGSVANDTLTAFFIDSGVAGLNYQSTSFQGVTDSNGGFPFNAGEVTAFSFNGLQIGSITTTSASNVITPFDLFNTTDINNQSVKNTLVLLQSLDNDQNPDNGISLPTGSSLDLSLLNIADAAFQTNLLNTAGVTSLVSESDAISHFSATLLTVNATTVMDGRWIMREAQEGDVHSVVTFESNGVLTSTESETCPEGDYWAASESSIKRNCSEVKITGTWDLSGKNLTMSNVDFTDNCTILTSSKNLITANCIFYGSGLGTELTRFERDIPTFSNSLIDNRYRELTAGGSTSFTQVLFSEDLSGSYTVFNENGVAPNEPGDLGDFTWNTTSSSISIDGIDNNAEAFSETWTLQNQVNGALAVSFIDSDTGQPNASILIPNFNDNLAKDIIEQVVYGVYDANSGACKQIYYFNNSHSVKPLRKQSSINASDDICDYSSPVVIPEPGDQGVYLVSVVNGAFIITQGGIEQEVCWPIQYSSLSANSSFFTVACAKENSTAFNLEIWRGL